MLVSSSSENHEHPLEDTLRIKDTYRQATSQQTTRLVFHVSLINSEHFVGQPFWLALGIPALLRLRT